MIVLTGATGFVGSQILRALLEREVVVRAIVRDSAKLDSRLTDQSSVEVMTTSDLFHETDTSLQRLVRGTETLVHAAWYTEPGKYLTATKNIECLEGTIRLAQAFAYVGGKRFVGLGTCAEYDLEAGLLRVTTPLKPASLYAACKASTYQVLTHLFSATNVDFVWCRLFYLYGEGEDSRRLVPSIRKKLAVNEPIALTSGTQIRDFLDVRDAGEMIAEKALDNHQGPINICSSMPITVRQLAERIADEYGRRDLLRFGERPDNLFDPPCVVGARNFGSDRTL